MLFPFFDRCCSGLSCAYFWAFFFQVHSGSACGVWPPTTFILLSISTAAGDSSRNSLYIITNAIPAVKLAIPAKGQSGSSHGSSKGIIWTPVSGSWCIIFNGSSGTLVPWLLVTVPDDCSTTSPFDFVVIPGHLLVGSSWCLPATTKPFDFFKSAPLPSGLGWWSCLSAGP